MTDDAPQGESWWYEDAQGETRVVGTGERVAGYFATLPDGLVHVLWYSTTACGKVVKEEAIPPPEKAIQPGSKRCLNCGKALEEKGDKLNWPV